jgi:hypothetical protein
MFKVPKIPVVPSVENFEWVFDKWENKSLYLWLHLAQNSLNEKLSECVEQSTLNGISGAARVLRKRFQKEYPAVERG